VAYNSLLVSQMTEPSDIDTNTYLHQRACLGDEAAKRTLIESNMPLVLSKVECFLRNTPRLSYLRNDLVGQGFLCLIEAVEALCRDSTIEKPSGYLIAAINNAFGQVVDSEVMVYYSRFTHYRTRGTDRKLPQQEALAELGRSNQEIDWIDAEDLLMSCCKDDRERRFVEMRKEGYSNEEIACETGISLRSVYRLSKRLQKQVERKLSQLR